MLRGFYKILSEQHHAGQILGEISFDKEHPIFSGHFPSVPVVPGVCMMQIIKELTEAATATRTRLSMASQLKFLTPINPLVTPAILFIIHYKQQEEKLELTAELKNADRSFFKMKASLTIQ